MANELEEFDMTAFGADFEFTDEAEDINLPNEEVEIENTDDNNDQEQVIGDPKGNTEEEVVANEEENNPDTDKEGSSQIYSSLAQALAEEGVISSLDSSKKIEKVEDLFTLIRDEIKKNELADLSDEQKKYLDAVRTGIQPEVYNDYQNTLKTLSSVTKEELESNDDLRKGLIVQDFVSQGMSKEKAEKLAQRSIDLGEDLNDSVESLDSLKVKAQREYDAFIQSKKQEQVDAEKRQTEEISSLKDTLYKQSEIIPGLKVNETVKQKVFDQMTKVVGKNKQGQPLNAVTKAREEDPVNFTIKMHYLFNITDGFKNFDKILTKQKSNAVKELEQKLRKTNFSTKGDSIGLPPSQEVPEDMQTILNNI